MPQEKPTAQDRILLKPGTLWTSVKQRSEHALNCGALLSIPTDYEFIEQNGVSFLVRTLSNLVRKDENKKKEEKQKAASGKEFNPFLPYEEDLWVADISRTHVCILNKFNVVDHHLLIITRNFEEQESLLGIKDFTAMWACLAEIDGLVFYNGGKIAGASQPHKHLQLVPLPFAATSSRIPIEPLIKSAEFSGSLGTIPEFGFVNAIARLNPDLMSSPHIAALSTWECYRRLLRFVGIDVIADNIQSGAYNLLATREWMLIVPRSHEEFQGISVNSLGFAGSLFVKDEKQMQILKDNSPMELLKNVAFPK